MNYHKLNVWTGWVIWLIASIVFLLTIEASTSFWDCGEYISSAYKLQVGHPPGAPLFMLLARFFSMWFGTETVAMAMNALSALCSSFTILFLFWSITHFAKKAVVKFSGGELDMGGKIAVMASGVVGALAYTFSDSFWFSAVEGEVYAMSSLFTAVVFWAILKWESMGERGGSLKWIVLIAYLMGLSIGVHLLNLLAIPAIVFVFYFKRYEITWKGLGITSAISLVILGFIQSLVIPGVPKLAGEFEKLMVNSMGLPFNTGVFTYIVLLVGLIAGLLYLSRKRNWPILNLSIVSVMMVLIGYSTFALVVIRSAANPPMDENNPENVFTLTSYLNREQYGSRPLAYGQYWNTPIDYMDPAAQSSVFIKSYSVKDADDKRVQSFKFQFQANEYMDAHPEQDLKYVEEYIEDQTVSSYNYLPQAASVFPRMHSADQRDIDAYRKWSNWKGWNDSGNRQSQLKAQDSTLKVLANSEEIQQIGGTYGYILKNRDSLNVSNGQVEEYRRAYENLLKPVLRLTNKLTPSQAENFRFFTKYQVNWMYWRYFMWNFSGKQNDIQGHGDILDGNWITGLDFIDEYKLGNREKMTDHMKSNRGLNKFYLIPMLLGLIGLIFQLVKNPKDFTVNMLLFLLTGLAIVVYLNQDPFQPRERDYAYVGSFYAFAIWIGMSISAFYYAATRMTQNEWTISCGGGVAVGVLLYVMETFSGQGHFTSLCILFMAGLTLLVMSALKFGVQGNLSNKHKAILCGVLGLVAPYLMMTQGWDDHSRADRRTGVDFAQNYLESLEDNAIIFTNGDNDTFPLWYAQEVEGIRRDVRVVNLSLLQTDWYADQMKRKAYEGDPVPIGLTEQQYRQGNRDSAPMRNGKDFEELQDQFEFFLNDKNFEKEYPYFPSNKWKLTIDKEWIMENNVVAEKDTALIVDEMLWMRDPNKKIIKNHILVYDIIRNNNWKRPIYFATTIGEEAFCGLENYFQLEGLAYRLVPIFTRTRDESYKYPLYGRVSTDKMYENVMEDFKWGNMEDTTYNVYIDENHTRMLSNIRSQFYHLSKVLNEEGQFEKTVNILDKCFEIMPDDKVPFDDMTVPHLAKQYGNAGEYEKASDIMIQVFENTVQELEFYESLEGQFLEDLYGQVRTMQDYWIKDNTEIVSNFPDGTEVKSKLKDYQDKINGLLDSYYSNLNDHLTTQRTRSSSRKSF